ncbi:DUF3565 domain-containing protein [Paraglaciecola arctica]|nr:DUF3565 domain-containing protein [Paraglaciecola arctica]MBU3005353.1 DUF3565 domain-containing protein [Paraglaciecola arctica]
MHNPIWVSRLWFTTEDGRKSMLGHKLSGEKCVSG